MQLVDKIGNDRTRCKRARDRNDTRCRKQRNPTNPMSRRTTTRQPRPNDHQRTSQRRQHRRSLKRRPRCKLRSHLCEHKGSHARRDRKQHILQTLGFRLLLTLHAPPEQVPNLLIRSRDAHHGAARKERKELREADEQSAHRAGDIGSGETGRVERSCGDDGDKGRVEEHDGCGARDAQLGVDGGCFALELECLAAVGEVTADEARVDDAADDGAVEGVEAGVDACCHLGE